MGITLTETKFNNEILKNNELVILPNGYESDNNSTEFLSSSISLVKVIKKKLPAKLLCDPTALIELREASWLAPAILLTLNLVNENPDAIKFLIDAVLDSLKKHSLANDEKRIKIDLYCENASGKVIKLNYDGDNKGLIEIKGMIEQVMHEK